MALPGAPGCGFGGGAWCLFVTDEVTDSSHWKKSILLNGIGALATFVVLVVLSDKFLHGAWVVVMVVPLLVLLFKSIPSIMWLWRSNSQPRVCNLCGRSSTR
jgi:hypothetical protein